MFLFGIFLGLNTVKMDEGIDSNVTGVLAILDGQTCATPLESQYKQNLNIVEYEQGHQVNQEAEAVIETNKQSIIWTKNATLMLLSLYETKVHMIENPKKKSKMWTSIAEELKTLHIEVTADQVRWKINALTKKYKDCVDNGQGAMAFKYFNEMHQILGRYNDETGTYRIASGVVQSQDSYDQNLLKKNNLSFKNAPFRKLRAEKKAKVELDNQWLEYLKRQEEQIKLRNERYERSIKIREEELELKKKELEIKQSIALQKLQLREKKQEEILKIEREKCALLRQLVSNQQSNQ